MKKITGLMKLKEAISVIWKLSKLYMIIFIISTVVNACSYFPLILFPRYIIDAIVTGQGINTVLSLSALMVGFIFVLNTLNTIFSNISETISLRMGFTLQNMITEHSLSIDYETYNNIDTLDKRYYAYMVVNDNNFVALLGSLRKILSSVIVVSGIILITIKIDIAVLALALVVIIIQAIFTSKNTKRQLEYNSEVYPYMRRNEYLTLQSVYFGSRKDLTMNNAENFLISKLQNYNIRIFDFFTRLRNYRMKFSFIGNFISQGYQFVMYAYVGYKAVMRTITIGEFSMYITALSTFVTSITDIINSIIDIKRRIFYFDQYKAFMSIENKFKLGTKEIPDKDDLIVEFKDVGFKYPGTSEFALRNVNVTIRRGEKIAAVGENGSGKTTFALLLMRFYEPCEGAIYMNGVDIREIRYEDYISQFSAVFQDFTVFAFTVMENVTLKEKVTENEINQVLNILLNNDLYDRVAKMKFGINTHVTNKLDSDGEEFSGGENQKIAISRALFKNAPFLVLDEPTSALDPLSEYNLYTKFAEMASGKTLLMISHRLSSTQLCDKIIVFNNHTVNEFGTHKELMSNNGLYREMFEKQSSFYIQGSKNT